MKKIMVVLIGLALVCTTSLVWAAAGSWGTVSYSGTGSETIGNFKWIQWTFTASADNATIPTLTPSATDLKYMKGFYLYAIETNPGSTGPTNGAWDVVVTDAQGLATTVSDRSSTATQISYAPGSGYYPFEGKAVTIDITDNAVNSASAVVRIWLAK